MVLNVQNKDEPCYDACKECQSKVYVTENGADCKKCNKTNVEHTQR